jgi:hypothetical protein
MPVSQRLRYEVLRRDNHACRYCGATAPDAKLHVDHVIPQALGGSDHPTNLVTSCQPCNTGKTSSMPNAMPVADVDQETFRRATLIKAEAEQRRSAIFAHLYCTWRWAWENTGRLVAERDEEGFTFETHKLLDCGASAAADLTEAAFRAGANTDVYLAGYVSSGLRTSGWPLTAAQKRFLTCIDAMDAWENAWDYASEEGTPDLDVGRRFVEEVGAAYDRNTTPAAIVRAAKAAGTALSSDLAKHVAELISAGGEV